MNARQRRKHRRIVTARFGSGTVAEEVAGVRALTATARCIQFDRRGGWQDSRKGLRLIDRLHHTLGAMPETEWTLQVLDHAIAVTSQRGAK